MTVIAISDVQVQDRHRADLGDLAGLAESLRELGQLQPIVVTSDLRLVAGGRRLAAAQSLGWTKIEAKIALNLTDMAMLLRAERDENTCRKPFTPTEEHSLYEALLALENSIAAGPVIGDGESADKGIIPPQTGTSERIKRSVADIATGSAGRHKTLEKVGEVKRVAQDRACSEQLQRTAREALAEMDRTGNVSGPYMRVKLAERAEAVRGRADVSSWSEDEQFLLKLLCDGQTVVVSLREHHANLVRWAEANGLLVAVDRRTEWGNPFEMPYDGDRETVIRNFAEKYLPHKPSLLSRISELKGKALACWCAPDLCHADILKNKVEE